MNLKKTKNILNYLLAAVLIFIAVCYGNGWFAVWSAVISFVLLGAMFVIFLLFWVCPHCGEHLGRMDGAKYCKHCGGKLFDEE